MEIQSLLSLDENGRWQDAVHTRRSRRSFSAPPDAETLSRLEAMAKKLSGGDVLIKVFGDGGVINDAICKGTGCFAVIGYKKGVSSALAGYAGEAFMLECEALGVGTCWAYSSCNRSAAQKLLEGYKFDCATPLGIASDTPRERKLKPMEKLTGFSQAQLGALEPWQKKALEFAQIAPSAMNYQPWRFVVTGEGVAAKRSGVMFAEHDCGIAALHLELGAKSEGMSITPAVL